MDTIAEIRRRYHVSKESISSIARALGISRTTVRKHLDTVEEPRYQRDTQPAPKLGPYKALLTEWLEQEAELPKKQRRTAMRLFEGLKEAGYAGAYDSVRRFVKAWKAGRASNPPVTKAFVPLAFAAGDVCQFDWSEETVELGRVEQTVKVAHFRLAHSRKMFVVAYPRETLEMVLDAHNRAFEFFGGVPCQMVYDNLKTVVDTILVGKERHFNRRFAALANHYLFQPVACTPGAGWEKGQVENQVGNVREWLFTPRAKFASLAELNAWLAKRCEELAARKHPESSSRTIAEYFAVEQPALRQISMPFDAYVETTVRASSTCLVRADHNRYSVPAEYAGKVVSVRVSAEQIRVVADHQTIAEHPRCFERDRLVCEPLHYLPILQKKPGALRHGAPFQTWELPEAVGKVQQQLLRQPGGDRAFVELLLVMRETSLDTLEMACELALESGVIQGSVIQARDAQAQRTSSPTKPRQFPGFEAESRAAPGLRALRQHAGWRLPCLIPFLPNSKP